MKLKQIEHICLAFGFAIITGLMTYALSDVNTSAYLFQNKDPKMQQALCVFFFAALLGVFAVHTSNNFINYFRDRKEPANTSSKEEAK